MLLSDIYIPKKDTQQADFLKKYPEYDGKGILIAVIDAGVDVSMPGLQKTSSGLPKILDCFDFTGAGDVYTSKIKEADENNILIGLSGRKLNIPQNWKNPSRKWHLGKMSYPQLFPRIKNEDLQKIQNGTKNENVKKLVDDKKNLLLWDCIVWNDGEKWQACLDTSTSGDLKNQKVLTNYRDEHEYGIILNKFAYAITIRNDGKFVEIFTTPEDHGTCVAYTAAAYSSSEDLNNNSGDGLAPGSQIISMKISRSSKTIQFKPFSKAILKCIELNVDVVNVCVNIDDERICKVIDTMVEKHGIIVVKAAGNSGPLYSTILPNDVSDASLNIGSALTPEIYSIFNGSDNIRNSMKVFPYSSIGPLESGARGITFTAPGVVKIPTPKWCLNKEEYTFGTSFAAPIIAGSIACLLSALKMNSIEYSPAMIKAALSKTSFLPDDGEKLEFGEGIIQIDRAFEFIKTSMKNSIISSCLSEISLTGGKIKNGIIFIKRETNQISKSYCFNINSTTKNISWILKSRKDSLKFIEYSDTIKSDKLVVKIDTSSLIPGNLYYAEIHGINSSNPEHGSQFYLPITVIIPERIIYGQGIIEREIYVNFDMSYKLFFLPSAKCQRCVIKFTAVDEIKTTLFFQYQILCGSISKPIKLSFSPKQKIQECFIPINEPNKVIQICVFQHCILKEKTNIPKKFNFDLCCEKYCY